MHPSPPEHDQEQRLADAIKADRLRLLYRQSLPAVLFSLVSAGLLSIIVWPHANRQIVIGWLIALVIASTARMILFASYHRAAPKGRDFLAWEKPYFITLMASSLMWGLGSVWMMPKEPLLYPAITYGFLMGMAGGAISVYSAVRPFAVATILVVLLPMTLWMFAQGETIQVSLGLAASLLLVGAIRSSKVMAGALHQTFRLTNELKASTEAAERLARTDALTGLNNRRAFVELAEVSISYCQRHQLPISTVLLDIDHFKRVNDEHGHSVGDEVLQAVARVMAATIRRSDTCARAGGEEFAILLPDTPLEEAIKVAEKVRLAIADHVVETSAGPLSVTASLGVANGADDLDSLMKEADAAMYRAKRGGRNRVEWQEGPVEPFTRAGS